MTYSADIQSYKAPNAAQASKPSAAAAKDGIGGGQGVGIQKMGADDAQDAFANLIISRLKDEGVLPTSTDTPPSSQTVEDLKTQLKGIIAQLGQNQAPAESAGDAELSQNGAAKPSEGMSNGLMNAAANGLLNNSFLAQQMGLDAQNAQDAEIISALKDVFADMGVQLNGMNASANANPAALENTSEQAAFNNSKGLNTPAQGMNDAHLENPTSPQETVQQSSSPAQQTQNASETSPLADNLADSPQTDQIDALRGAVTEEEILIQDTDTLTQAHLSTTGIAQSFVSVDAATMNANRSASAPANPQMAKAGQNGSKGKNGPAFGAAPNHAANSPLPQSGQAGTANGQAAQPSATTQNMSVRHDGAAPSPDFLSGQDFLNGFNNQPQSFDSQMAQNLRPDAAQNALGKNAATHAFTPQGTPHRPNAPVQQQQIVRAVTLNMTRNAQNQIERMSMQLEPAELGRVNIELKMGDDGVLKAHIMTDKMDTLHALQKDSTALHKAFQDAGLDMGSENFTFDLRDQNDPQFSNRDDNDTQALFDLSQINGIEDVDMNANDNAGSAYGQQYVRPRGVNVYV